MMLSSGSVIFVNRGWVPREELKSETWSREQGEVELEAVVTPPEEGGSFAPTNSIENRKFLWLNPADMAEVVGAELGDDRLHYHTLEVLKHDEKAFPIGRSNNLSETGKHYVGPETHAAYAFTWFSLSVLGFWMTYAKFRGKAGRRRIP